MFASTHAPDDEFIDVQATAELLRMPKPTVYHLLHHGKLPGQQVGSRWRVNKTTIDRDILGKETPQESCVVLRIQDEAIRQNVESILTGQGIRILDNFSANGAEMMGRKETVITDRPLADIHLGSFPGRVIAIIDSTEQARTATTNTSPVTLVGRDFLEKNGAEKLIALAA